MTISVEVPDVNDEFHAHLIKQNAIYGRGDIKSITIENRNGIITGVAVCKLQYGWTSFKFRVIPFSNGYTLKMYGRSSSVESDYWTDCLQLLSCHLR